MATEDTKIKESTLMTPTGVVSPAPITPTPQQQATITPQKEAMDASKIGTVPKLKLPPAVAPTASSGLDEYIAALTKTTKDNANQEREDSMKREEAALKQSQSDIGILTESIAGAEARKARLYEKEGINDIRKQVNEYTSQIEAEQLATRRKIDSLQKSGMTAEAAQGEANRIQRESTAKQADLAILQNAALRKYDTLSEIADRKIQAELEPMKARLDNLKFFYGENKDVLTKKQDQVYQERIKAEEREYNRQEQEKKQLSDTKLSLLKSAAEQQAPAEVLSAIQSSKTPSDAISAAGQYVGNILDTQLKKAQIAKAWADAKKVDTTSGVLTEQQLRQIDTSPQGKKLTTLSNMYQLSQTYKNLVDTYGFKASGPEKALIDRAYADLKIAYKSAAELGALTGPDVALLEEAIKPSAGGAIKFLDYKLSGGRGGVTDAIESGLVRAREEALKNYKQLTARNPGYGQSDYVKSLITPFAKDYSTVNEDNAVEGDIIQTEDGILLEVTSDGTLAPL